ncbi:unannotated protein [freshwater metagenome]|uniref:Unannotated protein n=1 Tax=freshwater metagenome TaxID=449393 RepID=A0A6J6EKT9_9ZZZZ
MDDAPPPRLIFTTALDFELTFCGLKIQSKPATTPDIDPEPLQPKTLTATIDAFLATP